MIYTRLQTQRENVLISFNFYDGFGTTWQFACIYCIYQFFLVLHMVQPVGGIELAASGAFGP